MMNKLIVLFIAFSLVHFSCSSSKKSAVPCPDFSRSRNMRIGHVQQKNPYPDQHERYRSNSEWAQRERFRGSSKAPRQVSHSANLYMLPGSGFAKMNPARPVIFTGSKTVAARMAFKMIPVEKVQAGVSGETRNPNVSSMSIESLQTGCDTIVFRNTDVIEARVIEIGQQEIRYRKCEDAQGPVFVAGITDVFMIKYPNGTRDYFTSERSPAPSMGGTAPVKTDGMAVAGFIGSLAGLFIAGIPLGIMAIVFGFVSLGKINRYPDRYKGRGFAIASIIIGALDVIGMLIVLASMT